MGAKSSGGSLYWDAGVNISKLKAGFKKGEQEARNFSRNVTREGQRVDQSFNRASKGVNVMNTSLGGIKNTLLPILGIAGGTGLFLMLTNQIKNLSKATIQFAKDFEMAMLEIKTISGYAQENFEGLQKEILNLAANTPDDILTVARAFYQIVSAGYDGAEAMEILRVSTQLSTGALTSAFTAADTLTSIMNAYGKEAGSVESISDKLFEVVKNGKTTMEEIGQTLGRVTGLAAQAGLSFNDLMAAYATGTKTIRTEEFTTAMRGVLVSLTKQQDDTREKAKQLGIQFDLTALKTKGLTAFLQDLLKQTNGNIDTLAKLFPNVQGLIGVLSLFTDQAKEVARQSENMNNSLGNTKTAAETMAEAVKNKWMVVGNRWKRQLEEIGDQLKIVSGGFADLMAEILEREMPDVIMPKVQDAMSQIRREAEQIEDREEKIAFVIEKIIELENERTGLSKEIGELQDKQAGSVRKAAEGITHIINFLQRGITGMEIRDYFTPGYTAYKQLEEVNKQWKINKLTAEEVLKLYQEILGISTEIEPPPPADDKEKTVKYLSDYQNELDELRKKLGTGPIEQDVQIILKISKLEGKVKEQYQKIRDKLKEILGDDIEIEPLKSLETPIIKTADALVDVNKEMKRVLKGSTALTEEEKQQLLLIVEQTAQRIRQEALLKDLIDGFKDASEIIGAIGYAISEIDYDLGYAIQKMADLAYNTANLITLLGAKNYVGAVATGIGMIGNILGLFKKEDKIVVGLERINRTLEHQSVLLANLRKGSEDYFAIATEQASEYERQVEGYVNNLKKIPQFEKEFWENYHEYWYNLEYYQKKFRIDTSAWGIDEFIQASINGTLKLDEAGRELLEKAMEAERNRLNLIEDKYIELFDFGYTDVAETIASGIIEGLKTSESGLGDWTDKFGELMESTLKKHILNALMENVVLTPFMKALEESLEGGITEEEMNYLEELFGSLVEYGEKTVEGLRPIFDRYIEVDREMTGLTGIVRGITEETGTLIAGQFTAMRIDLKGMSVSLNDITTYAMQSLAALQDIVDNTKENYRLKEIESLIRDQNTLIKNL